MGLWIKWDANAHKDEKIAALTDTQFRAFIVIIAEAKQLRSGGVFNSRAHVAACIGGRLARAVPGLLEHGLLMQSEAGQIIVSNYSQHQVDPTSAVRQKRWRESSRTKQGGITSPLRLRAEQSRAEKNPLSPLTGTESLKSIIRRVGA